MQQLPNRGLCKLNLVLEAQLLKRRRETGAHRGGEEEYRATFTDAY
jgi:hypothetical protein